MVNIKDTRRPGKFTQFGLSRRLARVIASENLIDHWPEGGGFGVEVLTTLTLQAGIPTEIDVLGYNGPGSWQLVIRRQDGSELLDTPGVQFEADGTFATPEPMTVTLAVIGAVVLAGSRVSRKVMWGGRGSSR